MDHEAFSENDFRLLGLKPGSKPSEVRQAYRTLVKKWHPDRPPYETLRDPGACREKVQGNRRGIQAHCQELGKNSTLREIHSTRKPLEHCSSRTAVPRRKLARPLSFGAGPESLSGPFSGERSSCLPCLLTATVFILTQIPSFLPDKADDTETHGPQVAKNPAADKSPGIQEPSEARIRRHLSILCPPPHRFRPLPSFSLNRRRRALFSPWGLLLPKCADIQGDPSRVQGQTWTYGLSEVQFRNGRVCRFDNFDGSLRVRMQPQISEDREIPANITIGSSEDEVLLVHGTPTRVEDNRWFYGFAELVFRYGRVAEYDNYFGRLKMTRSPFHSLRAPGRFLHDRLHAR